MCHSAKRRAIKLGIFQWMWNLPEESPFFEDLMQGTSSQSDSEMDDKIDQMTDEAFIALVDEIQRKRRRKIIEVARKLS